MADAFKLWCLLQVNVTVAGGGTRQVLRSTSIMLSCSVVSGS